MTSLKLDSLIALTPTVSVLVSIITILSYYFASYKKEYFVEGDHSSRSFESPTFKEYVLVCLGGSISLLFSTCVNFSAAYFLKDYLDPKYAYECALIFAILIPSIWILCSETSAFIWPLFHIQSVIVVQLALWFWATKLQIKATSAEFVINSVLNAGTFTLRIFVDGTFWTESEMGSLNIAYMCLFGLMIVFAVGAVRSTALLAKKRGGSAVGFIDAAAAEQRWAMITICVVSAFYFVFFIFEAGIFRSEDRFNLNVRYVGACYLLLSLVALVFLFVSQRKEHYQGVSSQVGFSLFFNLL
jgi:hypothetical protein